MPDTSTMANLKRCEDLWFGDCGLIVRAENTLLRVSREMLAARSPVFADMLSFSQPDDAEMIDGCPVVTLLDLSREVTVFFWALLNHEFFRPYPAKTDYPTIQGILHLSNKYQLDSLRKRALVHLGSPFEDWNPHVTKKVESSWPVSRTFLPSIIPLCREVSALWILPYAFVYYSQLFTQEEILVGSISFDGQRIVLAQQDQLAIISGLLTLRTEKTSKFLDFIWHPAHIKECEMPRNCRESRIRLRRRVEMEKGSLFPEEIPTNLDACWVCKKVLADKLVLANDQLAKSVPEIFGLPDWETLETMK
ncbi:hypothetical protein C8R43DRAFT_1063871 [Mycena crocata]|nr:hypothetical protein C8R43DRAFT_1063871 [Mycena crocata]